MRPPMALTFGTKLGPYEIRSALGAGGMREVYRARDTRLDRFVAVKILHSQLACTPELKMRFDREARTLSSLSHPHICLGLRHRETATWNFSGWSCWKVRLSLPPTERSSAGECGGEPGHRGRRHPDEVKLCSGTSFQRRRPEVGLRRSPFDFLQARFWMASGWPTIRPECELGLGRMYSSPLPLLGAPHISSLWEF